MQFWLKRMDVCVVKHPKGFFPVKVIWSSNGIHTNRLQCVPNCTCFFIELSLGGVHNGFAVFSVTAGNLVCISFPVLAKHPFIVCLCYDDSKFQQAVINFIDIYSLAHMKWDYKYHIVFAPKYRRKVFYKEKRVDIREIIRQLCQWKGVDIIEGEVCPDHIHILVSIPPKMSVSGFMGYLKGKSALLIFQRWGNMKFTCRNREFWCKGYLCWYRGEKHKGDQNIYIRTIEERQRKRSIEFVWPTGPIYGW